MTQTKAYCLKSPEGELLYGSYMASNERMVRHEAESWLDDWDALYKQGYRIVEVDVIERKGGV